MEGTWRKTHFNKLPPEFTIICFKKGNHLLYNYLNIFLYNIWQAARGHISWTSTAGWSFNKCPVLWRWGGLWMETGTIPSRMHRRHPRWLFHSQLCILRSVSLTWATAPPRVSCIPIQLVTGSSSTAGCNHPKCHLPFPKMWLPQVSPPLSQTGTPRHVSSLGSPTNWPSWTTACPKHEENTKMKYWS